MDHGPYWQPSVLDLERSRQTPDMGYHVAVVYCVTLFTMLIVCGK